MSKHLNSSFGTSSWPWQFAMAAFILLASLHLQAQPPTRREDMWQAVSNGKSSFRSLGKDFYVDLPMETVKDSRLVLFNFAAAKRLGIPVPQDPKALEQMVLEAWGKMISSKNAGSKTKMFATRYQDADSKDDGEANGDGRAVWAGEIVGQTPEGAPVYFDVVLKGVGQTPLAWLNHPDPAHKDGLLSMDEAIRSFIFSEALQRDKIDTTVDLAVIEIPLTKAGAGETTPRKAAISVRVGTQTRLAHLRYFTDEPEQFEKIFEYIVNRDLGRPIDTLVTRKDVSTYLKNFAHNLAEEAARYYDLQIIHGNPTAGNRTTKGSTIDVGTFRFLDGFHQNYKYHFKRLSLGGEYGQTEQLENYIDSIFEYMEEADYQFTPSQQWQEKMFDLFEHDFVRALAQLTMSRLGLSEAEQKQIPEETQQRLVETIKYLNSVDGLKKVKTVQGRMLPAAFEMRRILRETMASISQRKALRDLFITDKSWGTLGEADVVSYVRSYKSVIDEILSYLPTDALSMRRRSELAQKITIERDEGLVVFTQQKDNVARRLTPALDAQEDFVTISQKAESLIKALVDPGLPQRVSAWPQDRAVVPHILCERVLLQ